MAMPDIVQTDGASQDPPHHRLVRFQDNGRHVPQEGENKKHKENVVDPGGRQDNRQRHIWRVDVFIGLHQPGQNEHGDDKGHSDVGQALFGQIFMKRRFFPFAEKALDDGN